MFSLKKKTSKKDAPKKNYLQNPKILEVNLIKDEARVFFDWNKNILVLATTLFIASLFVLEIYLGLGWWEKKEMAQVDVLRDEVAALSRETVKYQNQIGAALAYKDKSASFSVLLDEHIYWSNFFYWLERNTLSSVRYESFDGDLSGNYNLSAIAPVFADVSWQVKAFLNDPLVEKVSVERAEVEKKPGDDQTGDVGFDLLLKVSPVIFKK